MTEQEVQAFCANNRISVSAPGQPLHVVNPDELPASVREFVNDDGTYAGSGEPEAEGVGDVPGTNPSLESETESGKPKQGKLPDGFPHLAELQAADINTYAQARALKGNYSEIAGIGEVRGKEIDEALK